MIPNVSENMIKASTVLNLSLITLNKRPRKIISSLTATIKNIAKFKICPIQLENLAVSCIRRQMPRRYRRSHIKLQVTGNTTATGADTKTKVALSTYSVVPHMSPHIGITSDELVEETTEYFRNYYNLNGITGNLTILAISDFRLPYKLNSSTIATPQRMVSTSLKR